MNNVAVIMPARLASERIPNKPLAMLWPGHRLIDNALHKLDILRDICPNVLTSFAEEDVELCAAGRSWNFDNIKLSAEDSRGGWSEMSRSWIDLPYDFLVPLNLVCHPFVRIETLVQIIDEAKKAPLDSSPLIHCKMERTLAWDITSRPLFPMDKPLDTKKAPRLLTPTHIADIYSPKICGDAQGPICKPMPFITLGLQAIELLDIDTPDQLELVQKVAQ